MLLPHDVAEMRIGCESRSLIQDGLPHGGPHRFACLVIAQLEVLPDFRILHALEASGPETSVGQEWPDFDEREPIRGEHIERIPQEFVGARSEMVKVPALLEHLGELRNADK